MCVSDGRRGGVAAKQRGGVDLAKRPKWITDITLLKPFPAFQPQDQSNPNPAGGRAPWPRIVTSTRSASATTCAGRSGIGIARWGAFTSTGTGSAARRCWPFPDAGGRVPLALVLVVAPDRMSRPGPPSRSQFDLGQGEKPKIQPVTQPTDQRCSASATSGATIWFLLRREVYCARYESHRRKSLRRYDVPGALPDCSVHQGWWDGGCR